MIRIDCVSKSFHLFFRPLPSENVGHKMLQKMGWKEGSSLGSKDSGIREPVRLYFQHQYVFSTVEQ